MHSSQFKLLLKAGEKKIKQNRETLSFLLFRQSRPARNKASFFIENQDLDRFPCHLI